MRIEPRPPILPWIVAAALVGAAGAWIVRDLVAWSAINWMNIYRVEDFPDRDAILAFFADLRIAIPPVLAAIEFLNHQLVGGTAWVTVHFYRFTLVAAYALAIALTYPSHGRLVLATGLSVLFLAATAQIHPAGPNVYDAVYPALILLFLVALRHADRSATAALLAGLALGLAELTRPFVILLLPVLLLGAVLRLWRGVAVRRGLRLLLLLLPVLLLSGGWHAQLWLNHGQVAWSNHAGFNLQRAWNMVAIPPLVPEQVPPKLAPDRMENFNTPEHVENSRRVQRAILAHVLANPGQSAMHAAERLAALVAAEVKLHGRVPGGWTIEVYQILAKYPALWMLLASLVLALAAIARPSRIGALLAEPGNLLILSTAATLAIMALTEAGEEARFLIAVLPCLAAVPLPVLFREGRVARAAPVWRRRAIAAGLAAMLAIEVFAQGAARRATGIAEGTGPDLPDGVASGDTLKIGQLHVRGGRWGDRERAAQAIAKCLDGLDLVGLNGVNGARLFSGQPDQAAILARVMGTASIFAPTERRWWSDWYGNALLTRIDIAHWRREPLPSPITPPRRNTLTATLAFGPGSLAVMVTQIDFGYDRAVQLAETIERFLALPAPAVLMGELNALRDLPGFQELLAMPGVQSATIDMPTATGPRPVDWIVGRGLYISPASPCDTGVSDHPVLRVEIKPLS